jgi:hypothetical protein
VVGLGCGRTVEEEDGAGIADMVGNKWQVGDRAVGVEAGDMEGEGGSEERRMKNDLSLYHRSGTAFEMIWIWICEAWVFRALLSLWRIAFAQEYWGREMNWMQGYLLRRTTRVSTLVSIRRKNRVIYMYWYGLTITPIYQIFHRIIIFPLESSWHVSFGLII